MFERFLLEDRIAVLASSTGIGIYDFDFRAFFRCRGLWEATEQPFIARIGAFENYDTWYHSQVEEGWMLLHTPQQHRLCSQLQEWYPLISDLTPRSRVYHRQPTPEQIEEEFGWPVFVKGVRQTSRHQRRLSIIRSAKDFSEAMEQYEADPILQWQPIVVREYIPLRVVEDVVPDRIPSSFEFRTFWWHGRHVGSGRYWWQGRTYDWSPEERNTALNLAEIVAYRINVPFLVVDLAMTASNSWIVIECNDGQESGYAGISPLALWSNILQQ